MTENLEKKIKKSSYKYKIEDFTAMTGLGHYAQRNKNLNRKSEEYEGYAIRGVGLAVFNYIMLCSIWRLSYELNNLIK